MRVLVQNTLTNRQWIGFDGPAGFTVGRDVVRRASWIRGSSRRCMRGWSDMTGVGDRAAAGGESGRDRRQAGRGRAEGGDAGAGRMQADGVRADAGGEATGGRGTAEEDALTELAECAARECAEAAGPAGGGWSQASLPSERVDQLNRVVDDLLLGEFHGQVFESEHDAADRAAGAAVAWPSAGSPSG